MMSWSQSMQQGRQGALFNLKATPFKDTRRASEVAVLIWDLDDQGGS